MYSYIFISNFQFMYIIIVLDTSSTNRYMCIINTFMIDIIYLKGKV